MVRRTNHFYQPRCSVCTINASLLPVHMWITRLSRRFCDYHCGRVYLYTYVRDILAQLSPRFYQLIFVVCFLYMRKNKLLKIVLLKHGILYVPQLNWTRVFTKICLINVGYFRFINDGMLVIKRNSKLCGTVGALFIYLNDYWNVQLLWFMALIRRYIRAQLGYKQSVLSICYVDYESRCGHDRLRWCRFKSKFTYIIKLQWYSN